MAACWTLSREELLWEGTAEEGGGAAPADAKGHGGPRCSSTEEGDRLGVEIFHLLLQLNFQKILDLTDFLNLSNCQTK